MKLKGIVYFVLLAVFVCLFLGSASAQEGLPTEVTALIQSALPGHSVSIFDQCGNVAVAVLTDGKTQTFFLAEEKNSTWETVICNSTALRQDAPVESLLLDTDETLFWAYNTSGKITDTYHAVRINGQWRVVSITTRKSYSSGNSSEYHLFFESDLLYFTVFSCDRNDNIVSQQSYAPVPAAWLEEIVPLNVYDDTRFPHPNSTFTHSWLSEEATALAAAELFPGSTFLGGCAAEDHLEFFLQMENGDHVMALCRFDEEHGWKTVFSTPLPEGSSYGSSLCIGDLSIKIGPVDKDIYGIICIYNMADEHSDDPMLHLGKNRITGDVPNGYNNRFGEHPWSDITQIDWNNLPRSAEEALLRVDSSRWAVVNNPNPEDRLHLRSEPRRSASSMGKYYNGTPVRILEQNGDWAFVDIFGTQGWMMKEYLSFGPDAYTVNAVFPILCEANNNASHYVYAAPSTDHPIANFPYSGHGLLVLAVVGDEWYHVWFPSDNLTGYVLQSDWIDGNG